MTHNKKRGLYWFRHDLRMHDNPALVHFINQTDEAIFVFVIDPGWFRPDHYQSSHMGRFRFRFLMESLIELRNKLNSKGQELYIVSGPAMPALSNLIRKYSINIIAAGHHPGVWEKRQWSMLKQIACHCEAVCEQGHTLFVQQQLPFDANSLPPHFTPFRKKIEGAGVDPCLATPDILPPVIPGIRLKNEVRWWQQQVNTAEAMPFCGGSTAGLARLSYYLTDTQHILRYKQTRNGLSRFDDSSKLSPWLANGSLSAKQVWHQVRAFETKTKANESTYWLRFELLWREYFQWYLEQHGQRLFAFDGVRRKKPLTTFLPQRFAQWCQGETPYAIVNACMKQLSHTGYLSNRGRQLVASCFVHELELDWRFGAAWMEQQLVDFDVASNWGNWQYLAGVGADPRGHRRFDLDKQAQLYDPQGQFVRQWQGDQLVSTIHSTDMVDWPKECL